MKGNYVPYTCVCSVFFDDVWYSIESNFGFWSSRGNVLCFTYIWIFVSCISGIKYRVQSSDGSRERSVSGAGEVGRSSGEVEECRQFRSKGRTIAPKIALPPKNCSSNWGILTKWGICSCSKSNIERENLRKIINKCCHFSVYKSHRQIGSVSMADNHIYPNSTNIIERFVKVRNAESEWLNQD